MRDDSPAVPVKKRDMAVVADGVYIPPAKRRALEKEAAREENDTSSSSVEVQKRTWDEQKRVIHGTINRLNAATIKPLIHDLFDTVNCVRMRGVLAKSLLTAAVSSVHYSAVYAAVTAVLNTKLPEIGELVVKRAVLAFRRHYKRKEKQQCLATAIFLGHLFHQSVVHELILLQILTVLLDETTLTDDSVEVAIQLLTVTGYTLLEVSPTGVRAVLERLRALLHEGDLDKRVEYKLEQLLALRKTGFRESQPAIPEELDLVEADDQITFDEISLDDETLQKEAELDLFRPDPDYEENEQQWSKIRAEILGLDGGNESSGEDATTDDDAGSLSDVDDEEDHNQDERAIVVPASGKATQIIQDLTEADLVHLRRTIYLTIMSSATFEECAHKLAKIDIPAGREEELINMLIECCSQERTFLRYYGLIAARFCLLDHNRWRDAFMDAFARQYSTIHRLETNKLRNVAKLFAHLLHTDSIPWSVLSIIHLNEDETTSSSRIFIKILVQEIAEAVGIAKLKNRFETNDPELAEWYKGMFPKDNVRNSRYAINFFTSIGLGPLTDDLREFLKNAPKLIIAQAQQAVLAKKDESDDSSSVSSTSSSSSSSSSSSESSSLSSSSSSSSYSSGSSTSSYSSYSRRGRGGGRRRRGARSVSSSPSSTSRSRSVSFKRSRGSSGSRGRSSRDKEGRSRSVSDPPSRSSRRDRHRSDSKEGEKV
jgi:pre-mRNA-splicing factor CWC22